MLPCYEIELICPHGTPTEDEFGDLAITTNGSAVLMTGRLDQSALHGVLERVRIRRWDLLQVRRTRTRPQSALLFGGGVAAAAAPPPAGDVSVSDTYEIRVVGALARAGRSAFADMAVDVEPTATVLSGEMDQVALHEVLDRIRALGLELIDVKPAPPVRL
jgi:hypothetical protein